MGELLELAVYNPAILSDESFIKGFVARQSLVERLLQRLNETRIDGLAVHHLILGQRGMGKTSLLRRLALGVRDDPRLSLVLLPLTFREEQYNVHNLQIFWLNCLDALGDWLEQTGQSDKAEALDRDVARLGQHAARADPEGSAALDTFYRWTRQEGRRPLLLIDNLDIILNGLRDQQWSLRRELQRPGGIVVVGASAGWLEATEERNAAFYDFFQVTVLEPLSADELLGCLRRLAALRGPPGREVQRLLTADPGRIRALHDLTGGNPRTLILLYLLLETDTGGDVLTDLERLLDQVSVLYKARVEDLPPQSRVVLDAVALAWDPVIAAEVAAASGLPTGTVSAQLTRLERDGVVQKVSVSRSVRDAFQVGERFFNIWYLMRHGPRRQRARLRWLSAFLRSFYSPAQLRRRARDLLSSGESPALERGQYLLALSDAVDAPAWRRALALEAEREIAAYLARSGKRPEDIDDLDDLPRPETAEDWDLQGLLLHRQLERPAEAETAFRTALQLDTGAGRTWIHLGNLLRDQGRYPEAESAYRDACNCNWGKWSWIERAELLFRTNRLGEVETAYLDAIAEHPEDAGAWGALAELLAVDPSRQADSETAFRRAMALDAKNPLYPRRLADLVMLSGRLAEAETILRDTTGSQPSAAVWGALGYLLLYFKGHVDEAKAAYLAARDLDPGDLVPISNLLAIRLLDLGAEPVADASFNDVVGRHPESGAQLLRGLRALVGHNLPAAVDGLAGALSDPDNDALTLYLGFVLLILREGARRGLGEAMIETLTERGLANTHWPLIAAYDAYLQGERRLMDVNPEVRAAATRIYGWLDAARQHG